MGACTESNRMAIVTELLSVRKKFKKKHTQ